MAAPDNRVLTDPSANWFSSMFANLSPAWAGFLRGLLIAIVMAALQAVVAYLQGHSIPGTPTAVGSSSVAALMWGLGWLDKLRTKP